LGVASRYEEQIFYCEAEISESGRMRQKVTDLKENAFISRKVCKQVTFELTLRHECTETYYLL